MIEPASLDISSLPWLPLSEQNAFPQRPTIYFAIDSTGLIQYIGRSVNPRQRWKSHHQFNNLSKIGQIRIAYLFVDSPDLLPDIERALIQWFKPPLNKAMCRVSESGKTDTCKTKDSGAIRVRKVIDIEVPGLGARIKQARELDSRSLIQICADAGMTPANWYKVEKEEAKVLPIETLRKIEAVLGVDLGVKFDD